MADHKLITANLARVVRERARPGITVWNRLEGRPRTERFDRALRAEIRDPLWMLTRQWQMGEFRGDEQAPQKIAAVVQAPAAQLARVLQAYADKNAA